MKLQILRGPEDLGPLRVPGLPLRCPHLPPPRHTSHTSRYTDHLCCGRFLDLTTLLPPTLRGWNLYFSSNSSSSGGNGSIWSFGGAGRGAGDSASASSTIGGVEGGGDGGRGFSSASSASDAIASANRAGANAVDRSGRPAMDLTYLFEQVRPGLANLTD